MSKEKIFDTAFQNAPDGLNLNHIREQWLALSPDYDVNQWLLPLPVWRHRPFDHTGIEAWHVLCQDLAKASSAPPFCIYLHVPFCSSKCHFCDCYSFKLGSHGQEHITAYIDHLCEELILWSRQGNLGQRPISTVHLGGGTPTFLGEAALARIAACCQAHFNITDKTEWALESTAESLTPGMIATMHHLGFQRLHIGVQSLEKPVRQEIKRRRPVHEVLQKIEQALALDWIVSVDLVCGLPGQTLSGFIGDIETLRQIGVNGFSLYELLIYPQNQKWAASLGLTERSHVGNYFMFQAGASLLEAHGFHQNLFNHWADDRDKNIYFTFPTRGEDCLAIGTIADGVIGDYHFRHPRYGSYMRQSGDGSPGLQGGLRRTAEETSLLPFVTAILSGHLASEVMSVFETIPFRDVNLCTYWQEQKLIVEDRITGGFSLTANGAWFAGNMVEEFTSRYGSQKAEG